MEDFIKRLFLELEQVWALFVAKLNKLDTDKANTKLDNVPSNLTNAEKTAIRNKIGAADSTALGNYIPKTEKGSNNGVAELDATGRVPASQLPSYVDDVVDLVDFVATAPTSGMTAGQKRYLTGTKKIFTSTSASAGTSSDPEADKIYVRLSNNTTWRWSGSDMIQLDAGLTLGETASTAYRGDRGKTAYNHSQLTGNPHNTAIGDISGLQNALNGIPTTAKQTNWDKAYQHSVDMGDATVAIPDWSTELENQINF